MRKLVLVVVALCGFAIVCSCNDTKPKAEWVRSISPRLNGDPGEEWRRRVEPRLSGRVDWERCRQRPLGDRVVERVQCGEGQPQSEASCAAVVTHAEARLDLPNRPQCLDIVIEALESLSRNNAAAKTDLAAAYYVRAQRDDNATDLLAALTAVEAAIAKSPRDPATLFNRALIQEKVGMPEEAISSWLAFLAVAEPGWATEAREHLDRLEQQRRNDALLRWPAEVAKLSDAMRRQDRAFLRHVVTEFPLSIQTHLEEKLLPEWAKDPESEDLPGLQLLAEEIRNVSGDPLYIDAIKTLRNPTKELRSAHLLIATARDQQLREAQKARESYLRAAEVFKREGSPFRFIAEIGVANSSSALPMEQTSPLLDRVEREASSRNYPIVVGRVQATRAHFYFESDAYISSLNTYDAALSTFARVHDLQSRARALLRRGGILTKAGQRDLAWRDAVASLRLLPNTVDIRTRHAILGEAEDAALALGNSDTALTYENQILREIHGEIARSLDNVNAIKDLQIQQSIALQNRAEIHLQRDDIGQATRDIVEAARLFDLAKPKDSTPISMSSRIEEIRGRIQMRSDSNAAALAFTRSLAIESNAPDEIDRGRRAELLAMRAEALTRANRLAEAERDLSDALQELSKQEQEQVDAATAGRWGEQLWSGYFSRFQDTYRALIGRLMDTKREDDAFEYAERARGYEPLRLALRLEGLPSSFQRLKAPMSIVEIRAGLPADTYLLQYAVLDDVTYVWILARDRRFQALRLNVNRRTVARWTQQLQSAVKLDKPEEFERLLEAPYDGLIQAPFAEIRKVTGRRLPRLIIVPDDAMNGLPLAALRDPVTDRYLLNDAIVASAGSAALYLFSLRRDALMPRTESPSVLLIGDPRFNTRLNLTRGMEGLPYASQETSALKMLYGSAALELTDVHATAPAFFTMASDRTIIHYAGHAIAVPHQPWRSLLLLAPTPEHNGIIDAQALVTQLHLTQTRLVVLSACSSADRLPVGAQGVAPLVRPFIAAGVPAVVGTLWNINDSPTTKRLLVSLHQQLRAGNDAASALRTAQLELLNSKTPVIEWAPFQVIGTASSPFGGAHKE